MSKRSELQKEYYNKYGNYKGDGKYNDHYVNWLEDYIISLSLNSESLSLNSESLSPNSEFFFQKLNSIINSIRWPNPIRLKMIQKSEFYKYPNIYQYGYYDGYQLQNEKIAKAILLIQMARSNKGDDATLQDVIITLIGNSIKPNR